MSYLELFYGDEPTWIENSSNVYYYPSGTPSRPVLGSKRLTTPLVFHVALCCESCVQKIRKVLSKDEEVEDVDVDMLKSKVMVTGFLNPERVLRKIRKVKKSATYWENSHDNGTLQDPYSHTADNYKSTDYLNTFDDNVREESSRRFDYDDNSSSNRFQNVPPVEYSSQKYHYYGRSDRAPSSYNYDRSKGSSYDFYRYL